MIDLEVECSYRRVESRGEERRRWRKRRGRGEEETRMRRVNVGKVLGINGPPASSTRNCLSKSAQYTSMSTALSLTNHIVGTDG